MAFLPFHDTWRSVTPTGHRLLSTHTHSYCLNVTWVSLEDCSFWDYWLSPRVRDPIQRKLPGFSNILWPTIGNDKSRFLPNSTVYSHHPGATWEEVLKVRNPGGGISRTKLGLSLANDLSQSSLCPQNMSIPCFVCINEFKNDWVSYLHKPHSHI